MKRALIFDIETIPNVELLKKLHPEWIANAKGDVTQFIADLEGHVYADKNGDPGMIPATMQIFVSIVAAYAKDFILSHMTIIPDAPTMFSKWKAAGCPTFVSYNGRGFDMPVLEQQLLVSGHPSPVWYADSGPSYNHPRNRYNSDAHWDCMEFQTCYGAGRANGGLDLQCKIIGAPGKLDVSGGSVWGMYLAGDVDGIHNYCKQDVLNTYLLWMRQMLVSGKCDMGDYWLGLNHLQATMDGHTEKWAQDFNAACDWQQLLHKFDIPNTGEVPA